MNLPPIHHNQIIDDVSKRYIEIYKLTCKITQKAYIGQAVSHILNHGRYRPYGSFKRFKSHVSEALSNKKRQSRFLNNAIRKYGEDAFNIEIIDYCDCSEGDEQEIFHIKTENTLFPNGYNLTTGGKSSKMSLESRKRLSSTNTKSNEERLTKYSLLSLSDIEKQKSPIRPLTRQSVQYGWYVYIKGIKTDFGGSHIEISESYNKAEYFIEMLKLKAKHLVAGNPLEPITTT